MAWKDRFSLLPLSDTESEDEGPKEKFPLKGQSNTSKGLPPAPVIRPPEDRRETPGISDRPIRIEPNIQEQQQPVCDPILREILTSIEMIKQQQKLILLQLQKLQANRSTLDEVPDLTDLRLPISSLEDLRRVEGQLSDQE
ncbi:hypothetical protein J4Q44_G00118310 [Coregonus suidteri]|uniref:Uncharacterized protein n=1 Tax=Coregonus suidteri TaxID=861788 RepID=A0AAN8LUD4_9TELE